MERYPERFESVPLRKSSKYIWDRAKCVVLPHWGHYVRNHPILHQIVHSPAIYPDICTVEQQDYYLLDMSKLDLDELHVLSVEHFSGDYSLLAYC